MRFNGIHYYERTNSYSVIKPTAFTQDKNTNARIMPAFLHGSFLKL